MWNVVYSKARACAIVAYVTHGTKVQETDAGLAGTWLAQKATLH